MDGGPGCRHIDAVPAARLALSAVLTVLLAAGLGSTATPVAHAKPGHDHPQVETRTFRISIVLNGHYHEEIHYTDIASQGFCPGTGQVLDADFSVTGHVDLRVPLDTTVGRGKTMDVNDFADNAWSIDLATVADGDPCEALQSDRCTGTTALATGLGPKNYAYAQGSGHKIVFGADLTGPPTVVSKPGDCKSTQQFFPVGDFSGLYAALRPYVVASMAVNLEKLNDVAKGHTISKTYKPRKGDLPSDYDVATCSHAYGTACSAGLTDFLHLITVKRLK